LDDKKLSQERTARCVDLLDGQPKDGGRKKRAHCAIRRSKPVSKRIGKGGLLETMHLRKNGERINAEELSRRESKYKWQNPPQHAPGRTVRRGREGINVQSRLTLCNWPKSEGEQKDYCPSLV